MRVTNRELRRRIRKILNESVALKYGKGTNIPTLEKALRFETLDRLNGLPNNEKFAALHNIIAEDNATPQEVKNLANFVANFKFPLASAGSSKITNLQYGPDGRNYHVQSPSDNATSSKAANNQALGSKFLVGQSGITRLFQACMLTTKLATNTGERCEIGLAMILAHVNTGFEYAALTGSEPGADVIRVGGDITYELKYSQTSNQVNDQYSNSPPSINKDKKYYVFLTDARGYVVSSPLLAQLAAMSQEVTPADTTDEAIATYQEALKYYLDDIPNLAAKLYDATSTETLGANNPAVDALMQSVIDKVNEDSIVISTMLKVIALNLLPFPTSGLTSQDKASTAGVPSHTQQEIKEASTEANEYLDSGNNLRNYSNLNLKEKRFLRDVVLGLLITTGAEQISGSYTLPVPRISLGGEGSPYYYMRKVGKAPRGSNFDVKIKDPAVKPSVKASMILGMLNDPTISDAFKAQVIYKMKPSGKRYGYDKASKDPEFFVLKTDASGNLIQAISGRTGQPKVNKSGEPIYETEPLLIVLRRDTKALDESLKELLRNPGVFQKLINPNILSEDDIFGLAGSWQTDATDYYFQEWASTQPEIKQSDVDIEDLPKITAQDQFNIIDLAFIRYTNYTRENNHDLQLLDILFPPGNNVLDPVGRATSLVQDTAPSDLEKLLKRYAALERKSLKFNESRVYENILKKILYTAKKRQ